MMTETDYVKSQLTCRGLGGGRKIAGNNSISNSNSNSNSNSSNNNSNNNSNGNSNKNNNNGSAVLEGGGVRLSANLMKSFRRKVAAASTAVGQNGIEVGSNNSSNAEGNNSDNSALVSLGNTSFGFNFDDSEEGMSNASPTSPDQSDSDGGLVVGNSLRRRRRNRYGPTDAKAPASAVVSASQARYASTQVDCERSSVAQHLRKTSGSRERAVADAGIGKSRVNGVMDSTLSDAGSAETYHNIAAEAAVAGLHSIATTSLCAEEHEREELDGGKETVSQSSRGKRSRFENDSGGYNSDDDSSRMATGVDGEADGEVDGKSGGRRAGKPDDIGSDGTLLSKSQPMQKAGSSDGSAENEEPRGTKKKRLDDKKREERNAREKERSYRISKQINELRNLLSSGGVIVPKGTKSSVLTETANYIRMLQQHQYRSEIDRHQLVQQIQMIGGGAHGPQAAAAIRHVAAQNGIMSFENFNGTVPAPKSENMGMSYFDQSNDGNATTDAPAAPAENEQQQEEIQPLQQTKIEDHEYRSVFNNCSAGMAIASMGGAFIDCNVLFCKLSDYTKQEVCSLTIFNLTARQDLQHAFDLISRLISPSMDSRSNNASQGGTGSPPPSQQPVILRGAMNNGSDLGLSVTLVKADDGIAKCFCVTLIKNPTSPFDDVKPIPATIELVHGGAGLLPSPTLTRQAVAKDGCSTSLESAPAFTSG